MNAHSQISPSVPGFPQIFAEWGGKKVHLSWLDAEDLPPDLPASSVHTVPIIGHAVVLVEHPTRGWELPGGHVDPGETPEEALNREIAEEALISGSNHLVGAIRVDNTVDPSFVAGKYPPVGHQFFYYTNVHHIKPFAPDHETLDRDFVELKRILPYFAHWNAIVEHAFKTAVEKAFA